MEACCLVTANTCCFVILAVTLAGFTGKILKLRKGFVLGEANGSQVWSQPIDISEDGRFVLFSSSGVQLDTKVPANLQIACFVKTWKLAKS